MVYGKLKKGDIVVCFVYPKVTSSIVVVVDFSHKYTVKISRTVKEGFYYDTKKKKGREEQRMIEPGKGQDADCGLT